MSPPIFTPDGSKVNEIVLPDGEKASEVVAPDGSVVFEDPIRRSGIIDSFEDGNLDEYTLTRGGASIVSSPVFDGSKALNTTDNNVYRASTPGDGLPIYPKPGEVIEVRVRLDSSQAAGAFWFGGFDDNNRYSAIINSEKNNMIIERDIGGEGLDLASSNVDPPLGEFMRYEIDWGTDNTITFLAEDANGNELDTITATDSTYTSEGVVGFSSLPDGAVNETTWDFARLI
jgi:hypothetical protein